MKLFEILNNQLFYHGSPNPLPIGIDLPAKRIYQGQERSDIDDLADRYVPQNQSDRHHSWYLTTSPDPEHIHQIGGSTKYIYLVQPVTPVFMHFYQHLVDVGVYYRDNFKPHQFAALRDPNYQPPQQIIDSINRYWNGNRHPKPNQHYSFPEYTTRIISCIKLINK